MVITETFYINDVEHVRHYSDSGVMIASDDGVEYEVAEDLAYLGKVYHETKTPVPVEDNVTSEEILALLEAEL